MHYTQNVVQMSLYVIWALVDVAYNTYDPYDPYLINNTHGSLPKSLYYILKENQSSL